MRQNKKKLCKVKQRRVHSTHHKHIRFVTNANIFSRCARARATIISSITLRTHQKHPHTISGAVRATSRRLSSPPRCFPPPKNIIYTSVHRSTIFFAPSLYTLGKRVNDTNTHTHTQNNTLFDKRELFLKALLSLYI